MKRVLFVCVHNSGRSQMAEAFFNHLAQGKAIATSAGTRPAAEINPTVVEAMREVGIDISDKKPRPLTFETMEKVDIAFTMGCTTEEVCPANLIPTEDWQLEDPHGKPIAQVRKIRDEIKSRVVALITRLSTGTSDNESANNKSSQDFST